jgi:hypothetical protein
MLPLLPLGFLVRRAAISTSGVTPRKSAPVLDMLLSNRACAWLCSGQYSERVMVTRQLVASQPCSPWRSVARTVSSTALKNA